MSRGKKMSGVIGGVAVACGQALAAAADADALVASGGEGSVADRRCAALPMA
jgi:hypothetical protein